MKLEGCNKGLLFTSLTCPKCPEAKEHLKDYDNIEYLLIPKDMANAKKYSVMSLPSLVLIDKMGTLIKKLSLHEILDL